MQRAVGDDWKQEAWRGSPKEFVHLIEQVRRLVSSNSNGPDSNFTASVARGDDDLSFDEWSEFDDFVTHGGTNLRRVRRITISIGQFGVLRASLDFERTRWPGMPGVEAKFKGENPIAVNGLSREVRNLVSQNGWPLRMNRVGWASWTVGLAIIMASWLAGSDVLSWLGIAIVAVGYGGAWFVVPLLFPRFELLDPSTPPTPTILVRQWLAGSGRWLLAAVAGALIYAAVDRML
ncbi:MAG TPA: hypothetical protein VFY48_11705 [Solirubrobacterales bacterium]|nr:hypothetical protein [Solirubrobacterales bacterium]